MDKEQINQNIKDGKYDTKLPFPKYEDEKSGKISKEQSREMRRAWREDENVKVTEFRNDCRAWLDSEMDRKATDMQFTAIFERAWENGHSSGYYDVLWNFEEILDVVMLFWKDILVELHRVLNRSRS